MRGIDIQDRKANPVLSAFDWDDEAAGDDVMARARDYEALIPEVLLREAGRCPHRTAYGHKGVTSVEFCGRKSKPDNPYGECARHERDGIEEHGRNGYLAAVRRNTPTPIPEGDSIVTTNTAGAAARGANGLMIGGDYWSTPDSGSRWPDAADVRGPDGGEFEDLATVRRFAEQVCALGEGSDFVQTIHACSGLQDMVRDFGGDMNTAAAALVDAAVAVARDGEALREQATQVAALAQDMSGA